MGGIRSACGIICILLLLRAETIQCPSAVNTQPGSNFCVLRTQKGVDIRASLKRSPNASYNLHRTLDLMNARCCFNPDKKCALSKHLNVTLNNISSLLKYPIHPLWMVVNNKRIPHLGVWDELWYSFYEFGKPSLIQTADVQITHKTSFNSKETFSVHLSSEKSVSPTTHTETPSPLVINPHHSPVREEDRIIFEDVFLLIPEVTDNLKKDSQTRRGPRDYLVLNQSLFDFPNSDCFNEKARFLSLVIPKHRPCVEASSVDLEEHPYDFYVKAKVKEIRREPTEFFLSSFGTLHNPTTASHHRSSVIFISQQPLIFHIFIPNEETPFRLRAAEFSNTVFGNTALYFRHLGSFLNDQWTLVTSTSGDGYDVIVQHLGPLTTFIKGQWSSAVGVLYTTAAQLCDILGSFDKFDRISFEKSIDYQWNLIWSYIDHACQKIGVLRADGDATMAPGWIAFSLLIVFPLLLVKWLVTSLRNQAGVQEMDDIIMLDNDNGELVFGRNEPVVDFLREAFNINIMYLPQWADDNYREVLVSDRASSDCDVTPQRRTEFGSVEVFSVTDVANEEYDRLPLRRFYSLPCIATSEIYQYDDSYALTARVKSSYDFTSVTHWETKTRVLGPPTGKLTTVLKHYTEELSEDNDGTGTDIDIAQRSSSPKVSQKYKDFIQARRAFLDDIDDTYGPPTDPATHLTKEESSGEDEGRDLDVAHKIGMASKSSVPKISPKYKDFIQARRAFLDDIDDTYGPPTEPATHLTKEDGGRDFLVDIDETLKRRVDVTLNPYRDVRRLYFLSSKSTEPNRSDEPFTI